MGLKDSQAAQTVLPQDQQHAGWQRIAGLGASGELGNKGLASSNIVGSQKRFERVKDHRQRPADVTLQRDDQSLQVFHTLEVHIERRGRTYSLAQHLHRIAVLPHRQHQVAILEQRRDQAGVDQRGLAHPRRPVQHHEGPVEHFCRQSLRLSITPVEHHLVGRLVGAEELVRCSLSRPQRSPVQWGGTRPPQIEAGTLGIALYNLV